jgi:hypothetical protein
MFPPNRTDSHEPVVDEPRPIVPNGGIATAARGMACCARQLTPAGSAAVRESNTRCFVYREGVARLPTNTRNRRHGEAIS